MSWPDSVQSRRLPSRLARYAAGIVFIATMVLGGISAVGTLVKRPADATPIVWNLKEFWEGETANAVAKTLGQAPLPRRAAQLERGVSWLISGSLGPQVRQGCEGWLFLVDEFDVYADARQNMRMRLDTVTRLSTRLHAEGIALLVVTIPDKSRIHSDQLCGIYRPGTHQQRLDDWEAGLRQRGVWTVSVTQALRQLRESGHAAFLRIDSHWSEHGAEQVAQEVAQETSGKGLSLTPRRHYTKTVGEPVTRNGDLVRLAGIDWLPPELQPRPDTVRPAQFDSTTPGVLDMADTSAPDDQTADDLFGDLSLPSVALVGTSYSRTSSFRQFLEWALKTPVPSFAQDGGDFWGSVSAYLTSSDFREAAPRLVIWEIPERVLQKPLDASERAWMESLDRRMDAK